MLYAPFCVVADANVLIPLTLSDTLLNAAQEGLIQIHWTEEILEETRRNLVQKMNLQEGKAVRRIATMKDAFPEAMVTGHERLIPAMTNDSKDRHVLAAAVHIGAQTIVTNNLRHFGQEHLPPSMQAQDPDTFLLHLLDQAPTVMHELLLEQSARLRNPPKSLGELLEGMARTVPRFVKEVRRQLPPSLLTPG